MRKLLRGRRRAWLALPVVLLVAAASSGAWLLTRDSSEAAASTTATVSTQTMQETVSADGTLAARRTRDESFAVSGTVTGVAVSAGDRVEKGDVLATVGSDALAAARTAAVASLNASIAQLDDDEDADASDVQIAADQAAIVSARASLSDARDAVEDATLRATIPGTVTVVGISKGDVVGSTTGATAATADTSTDPDFTIVSTNEYVVSATVAAEDVKQLKKGMQAQITATGVDDTIYGTVKSVGLVAQTNDSGAAVFPVTIEVTGKQKDLFAGVSATVTVIVKETPDVLTVVSRALTTEDNKTYVTEVVDGDEVKTEVKTGETYGMTTEITSGLEDGDTVVIPGFTAPTGSGNTGENGFPGGGELPDFSQLGGGNGFPAGGPPQ